MLLDIKQFNLLINVLIDTDRLNELIKVCFKFFFDNIIYIL